ALQYDDIVPVAMEVWRKEGDLLLLTSYPIPAEHLNDSIRVVQAFYPAIVGSEEYYLYDVKAAAGK
ncbi:MAG: hypothetical protein IT258_02890, partial [Saprospiraceae bacterium]|nr:hypothetical protein [Saprospiraceae bacterium]